MQIRLSWGGGAKKQWRGNVSIDRGTLNLVRLLGDDVDTASSIWEEQGRIEISQPSPRVTDAIDIRVAARPEAVLKIEFQDAAASNAAPLVWQIPLRDVLNKEVNRELDKTNNRLRARRIASDALVVKLQREHLVFLPGEKLQFDVEPNFLPVAAGTALQLRARLLVANNSQETGAREQTFKSTADGAEPATIRFEFTLPTSEGVYDVVIEAISQTNWGLTKKIKQIAERRLQLVVIDDRMPQQAADANAAWTRVLEIDPANPAWYERFRAWPLGNSRQGPLGNGGMQSWQHPTLGSMARLKEHRQNQEPFWEAYPLAISRLGMPHVLEIEYPSDIPQSLGVSIVEPNAAGQVTSLNVDAGFFVIEEPAAGNTPRMLRHHVIFWPRTATPMVLLANRGYETPAVYGKIRVITGPSKLPPLLAVAEPSERLLAGYMGRPLLAENFGASEVLEPTTGRSLKDWRTFYSASSRLAEYLHHVGYNGQMLTVIANASSIYPSRHLQPTSRYDNGEWFESGQDPVRKDVLEMTLRIFDREGIKLIPSLRFDGPIPELEARLRRGQSDAEAIRLIGASGRPYVDESRPNRAGLPHYNPLNPHVQEAMLAVVRELAERYSNHPAFTGIAIELSADSSTQLPGEAWGLDDETIERFENATNVKVPGAGPTRFADRAAFLAPPDRPRFAAGPNHAEWLKWRAQVLADFYRRMQAELTATRRDAVLYLAASNLFDGNEARQWLRPTLPPRARADEVLLTLGLKPDLLQQDRGLVFLRPQLLLPPGLVVDQAVAATANQALELDASFSRLPATGSLLLNEPAAGQSTRQLRLESFDQKSPFGKEKTALVLHSHLLPSERRNRERFVHSLATLDAEAIFDGGWMLPMGQEDSIGDLVASYRRLPAGKFELHPDSEFPVTIRTRSVGNSTYSYIVNDSEWPTTLEMKVDLPPGSRIDELTGRRRLPAPLADRWQLQLEPFDLMAVRFGSPNAKIMRAQVVPHPDLQAFLRQRTLEFKERVVTLDSPPKLNAFVNPNFESPPTGGQIPGWMLLNQRAGGSISLAPEGPANSKPAGKQSLMLRSNGQKVSLRSNPFEIPRSRRVAVTLWLKVPDANQQPPLQLVIEDNHDYRRAGPIGAFANNNLFPIPDGWWPFAFSVNDLPNDSSRQIQFGLDLNGPGEVSMDDVEIVDLPFEIDERMQLNQMVVIANGHMNKREFSESLQYLDEYWPRFILSCVPQQGLAQVPNQPTGQAAREEEKPARGAGPLEKWFKR